MQVYIKPVIKEHSRDDIQMDIQKVISVILYFNSVT